LSKIDIVLALFVLLGAWGGFREGFLMELVSFAAILVGVLVGFKLMGLGMLFLEENFNADKRTLPYLSFGLIFIIIVVLVRLMGGWIKSSIDKSFLGTVDQAMGAVLGGFRMVFMLSIVLWIVDSLRISIRAEWTEGSWLYPFTANLAPKTVDWIGGFLPVFKEIFSQF
jgi:membrane protein required for colicin V production